MEEVPYAERFVSEMSEKGGAGCLSPLLIQHNTLKTANHSQGNTEKHTKNIQNSYER